MTVLSNAPVQFDSMPEDPDDRMPVPERRVRFQWTPPISSYLVCVSMAYYDHVERTVTMDYEYVLYLFTPLVIRAISANMDWQCVRKRNACGASRPCSYAVGQTRVR
jgi:hypothetical protein